MLNKSEMNLLNKVMESSIEFKMKAYKLLGEDLVRIQNELSMLLGTKPAEVKYVAPVVPEYKEESTEKETKEEEAINTILGENIKEGQIVEGYCGSCCEETKQYRKGAELICLQCGEKWELITYEEYEPTNEFHKEKQVKKDEPKANHKVSNVKKLINCGESEGDNEVLFVEKRKDSKHLWFGQIRINNFVRNFHWSNELPMPVVYGIESKEDLETANELIRLAVSKISPKELTMYDNVLDHPDFGGFRGRQFLGALHQGAYIYLTPEATDGDKETDIIAKGYTNGHAFIVRRDQEVFWRNYNYVFSKKPFESTASKGFSTEMMVKNVSMLYDAVCEQFEKLSSAFYRTTAVKKVETKTSVENPETADLSNLL